MLAKCALQARTQAQGWGARMGEDAEWAACCAALRAADGAGCTLLLLRHLLSTAEAMRADGVTAVGRAPTLAAALGVAGQLAGACAAAPLQEVADTLHYLVPERRAQDLAPLQSHQFMSILAHELLPASLRAGLRGSPEECELLDRALQALMRLQHAGRLPSARASAHSAALPAALCSALESLVQAEVTAARARQAPRAAPAPALPAGPDDAALAAVAAMLKEEGLLPPPPSSAAAEALPQLQPPAAFPLSAAAAAAPPPPPPRYLPALKCLHNAAVFYDADTAPLEGFWQAA